MKCAVFNGKCNMTIDEREIPEPAADEVLIKIMACGVCGSDVHIFFGDQGSTELYHIRNGCYYCSTRRSGCN